MRLILRLVRNALLILLLLALLLGGGIAWLARATMPDDSGAAEIPGLENPVSIAFDANQVPTVRARSVNDAAAALGYLHARERLFQMELMRRAGRARLAELLGASALRVDRYAAALDLPVPRLLLQPLAENALRHGLAPRAAPGTLTVHATRDAAGLEVVVANDGVPLVTGRPDGVGLATTRERLATRVPPGSLTLAQRGPRVEARVRLPAAAP